jgi:hypothetical protein
MPTDDAGERNPNSKPPKWNRGKNKKATISGLAAFINAYRNEQKTNRAQEKREDRGKKWREIWTLIFVILTTGGIFYQAIIFSGQLSEMKSSGEQTGQLIGANAKLAEAAAKQAEAADKQANAMIAAVEVSRESLIAAGRAWVGPRLAKITSPIEVGKPIELAIEYANSGREPALDFVYSLDGFASSNAEEKRGTSFARVSIALNNCSAAESLPAGQVVFPSTGFSAYNLNATIPNQTIDQEIIDGEKTLILQGCFLYRSFKVVRHSYFCYFYRAKTSKPDNLNICTAGHYAD